MLARSVPGCLLRSGHVRQFGYRWARAVHRLGLSPQVNRPELADLLASHMREQDQRRRQYFNLCWRANKVETYQNSDRMIVSDELLIQGIFVAVGPVARASPELRRHVEAAVLAIYEKPHVEFVHIDPPRGRWLSQVWGRPQRRSRFGRSTDSSLMELLEGDRLYPDVILPILRENRFTVHTLTDTARDSIAEIGGKIASNSGYS